MDEHVKVRHQRPHIFSMPGEFDAIAQRQRLDHLVKLRLIVALSKEAAAHDRESRLGVDRRDARRRAEENVLAFPGSEPPDHTHSDRARVSALTVILNFQRFRWQAGRRYLSAESLAPLRPEAEPPLALAAD